jgi:hypothetical protein
MYCCAQCFGDEHLKEHIEIYSEHFGHCTFCPTQNTQLIKPEILMEKVSPLLDLYIGDSSGKYLIDLLRDEWNLFPALTDENASKILDTMTESSISRKKFSSVNNRSSASEQWDQFKKEVKHENRFFPKSFPVEKKLEFLLSNLSFTVDKNLLELYRARLNEDNHQARPSNELGAPPAIKASGGRANPVGIPYLYVGSTKNTAISEISPHKIEAFTIGIYSIQSPLNLVDLRSPKEKISPFVNYDEDGLEAIHTGLPLLETLGSELSKPIAKSKAELEYLSSQYLCEFIKYCGYDGVTYKSSLGDGDNYAIFSPSSLICSSTELHNVDEVNILFSEITLQP